MNKVVLTGRLVRDAELSYIASTATPKMSFSMAVERNYQKDKNNKKVDFINCEMIGKHTENLVKYQGKGSQIGVIGSLNIDQYQDQEGNNRTFTKVVANEIEFLGGATTEKKTNADTLEFTDFQEVDNDEIPF